MAGLYLIWSNQHRAWWRPRCLGYTHEIAKAGRFQHDAALQICLDALIGWANGSPPPEIPVAESDAVALLFQQSQVADRRAGDIRSGL